MVSINGTFYFTPFPCVHFDLLQGQSFIIPMIIIETPINIWSPKVKNKYTAIDYGADLHDGIFYYTHYVNAVFNPKIDWTNHNRTDIIK